MRAGGASESCVPNRAIPGSLQALIGCNSDGDFELIFRLYCDAIFRGRNCCQFQARDSGDSRFCAAKHPFSELGVISFFSGWSFPGFLCGPPKGPFLRVSANRLISANLS